MSLPVNIENIVYGKRIESSRVEYKSGWNPTKILHTVCAFANDIEEVGGGYILVGISEEDGLNVIGLTDSELKKIENELFSICNLITPHYIPGFSVEEIDGKKIAVIWAVSDVNRPFRCPVSIGKKSEISNSERACFIRKMSHTIRASQEEELNLLIRRENPSFDSLMNVGASVEDIHMNLVNEYLIRVGSKLHLKEYDRNTLLRMMNLIKGPEEVVKPINVALMMFNSHPEDFFPYARIDVVFKKDPTGSEMTEYTFDGPLDSQIRGALQLLKEQAISTKIIKVEGQAEALRLKSYPFGALEEAVVNAVYHKSYSQNEPVTITVNQDSIDILNLPGPDPSISDESIREHRMISTHYRNKRLGDFLKELGLAEGRNTGIPKIIKEMEDNGSEPPVFMTDEGRSYMRVVLPIHSAFRTSEQSIRKEDGRRDPADMESDILEILRREGCLTTRDISERLGYPTIPSNLRKRLNSMLAEGKISYLYPESPKSSKQRLCLKSH